MKVVLYFSLLLLSGIAFGQTDIVDVDGKGNREIESSFRITESPKILDSIKATPIPAQPLLQLQYETKIQLDTIVAATVETTEKLKALYPFYAKLGIGSTIMPLGELYFNSTRSRSNFYGVHVKHLSSFGEVKDRDKTVYAPASFDQTSTEIFGKTIQNKFSVEGKLGYNNNGFHYYGIPNKNINADSIRQRFQIINAESVMETNRGDSSRLNVKVGLNYRYFTNQKSIYDTLGNWKTQENKFDLTTKAWYNKGTESFYTNIGVRFNGYKYGIADSALSLLDTGIVNNNTIIDLNPGVHSELLNKKLRVDVGLGLSIDINSSTKSYLFPKAEVKYTLVDGMFIPYLGIRGGLKQNTFVDISKENPYVLAQLSLKNEITAHDIYFGLKGNVSKRISFGVNASFSKVLNRALFITDTLYGSLGNRFGLVYDTLNLTVIEASFAYQLNEKLKIDALGRFNSYEMMHEARAWNLPQVQFLIRGHYNLYDKFIVNLDFNMAAGRYAQVYENGANVQFENNQYFVSLKPIFDGNIGLEYRYNPRVSAFLQINNVAAQRYNRWYNYPVQPIQIMGGITARF
jgi:hypothetical protein